MQVCDKFCYCHRTQFTSLVIPTSTSERREIQSLHGGFQLLINPSAEHWGRLGSFIVCSVCSHSPGGQSAAGITPYLPLSH